MAETLLDHLTGPLHQLAPDYVREVMAGGSSDTGVHLTFHNCPYAPAVEHPFAEVA
jgi:hypothetical protein